MSDQNVVWRKARAVYLKYMAGLSDADFARRFNQVNAMRKRFPVRYAYLPDARVFAVHENGEVIHVARRARLDYQKNGLAPRRAQLIDEYVGNCVEIESRDFVIDCGANIGEFSMICAGLGARVLAFEPDPVEFRALERNAGDRIEAVNAALWNDSGEMDFFDKNDTGDSSLFDPGDAAGKLPVRVVRLDSLTDKLPPEGRIKLLKLEAEGAEPEILQGAAGILERIDFVAADMGPERGMSAENTVPAVTSILQKAGFEMIRFALPRCTGVFRNTRVSAQAMNG